MSLYHRATIEAENNIVSLLMKSGAAPMQKLSALLKMATGEAAPPGPAAERAKACALTLAARPELRGKLLTDAEAVGRLRLVVSVSAPSEAPRPDRNVGVVRNSAG